MSTLTKLFFVYECKEGTVYCEGTCLGNSCGYSIDVKVGDQGE